MTRVRGHDKRKMRVKLISALLFLIAAACVFAIRAEAQGSERITDFNSQIVVNKDSSMKVTETIIVESTGDQIKRGIYRDFPTKYKDGMGNSYTVGFEVISVLRDGKADEYRVESVSNGKRVYIGREDYILPPGRYTYRIVYRTNRQLGFFKDHDELYWNVTGNGWAFPIERASASVALPGGVPAGDIKTTGYTGPQGSRAQDLESKVSSSGMAQFVTTRPLSSREGLTIVVAWPKGYVTEPTGAGKVMMYSMDNSGFIIGIAGLVILLLYYLIAWFIAGRDPKTGTIIPLYKPPHGMSPAAMRFIREMGYDQKAFAATLINMAVKGYLLIEEAKGKYTLVKGVKDEFVLDNDEREVAEVLELSESGRLELKRSNHAVIRPAMDSLRISLNESWKKPYFKSNGGFFLGGLSITGIVILLMILFNRSVDFFMVIWSLIWGIAIGALVVSAVKAWVRAAKSKDSRAQAGAVILTALAVPFLLIFLGVFFVLSIFFGASIFIMFSIVMAIASVNTIFFRLLKAHTPEGRRVMDKIEGFRMYLSVAEKDRMNLMNPPERTPELFEMYLPYALALGVEQQWGEQFTEVLSAVSSEGTHYHPAWYRGTMWNSHNIGAFTGSLGSSFSTIVSSASKPPGSSSGMGGGGSSGGGGGGGGGGGW